MLAIKKIYHTFSENIVGDISHSSITAVMADMGSEEQLIMDLVGIG